MLRRRLAISTLLIAAIACASAPASKSLTTANAGRNADVITAAELADPSITGINLLEAVQRLRPRFLRDRGSVSNRANSGGTHLSIDGGPLVGLDQLTRLRPNQVEEVRFLGATDAAQRFGASATSGAVILVKIR